MSDCPHMFQRVDPLGRFTCADCGEPCGSGDWVRADQPLTRSQVEAMRSEFETRRAGDADPA